MVPPETSLRPAGIELDVLAQRVAGLAGLADRIDPLRRLTGPCLPPTVIVVPHLPAFDLQTHDAGAIDRDQHVDLVVFVVVGDALAVDDEVVIEELLTQEVPDGFLARGGEPR